MVQCYRFMQQLGMYCTHVVISSYVLVEVQGELMGVLAGGESRGNCAV